MRVLMTGGGTGGHVNPALAIANTIRQHDPEAAIAFVGTTHGIENKLVPAAGYELYHVEVQGIRRSLSPANLKAAWLAAVSPERAKKIIREFKPDLVVGTGGYVSWPVVKAAASLKIPTALHEANAVPGVAVKMLAGSVDRIYLNFEETGAELKQKNKLLHVGNPLRGQFMTLTREEARKQLQIPDRYKYFILSYGGSMGAEKVNDAVLEMMREFSSRRTDIFHLHATGSIEYAIAKDQFERTGLANHENLRLVEYIYDMPVQMAAADLTINRAGAMTVSELAMMGRASIFIPSPNVTNNHQYKNAKVLEDAGAAVLIQEKELMGGKLADTVMALLSPEGEARRRRMEQNIRRFAVTDANERIYRDLVELVERKRQKKH